MADLTRFDDDEEFPSYLNEILALDSLDPIDAGITKQVADRGIKSLSPAQRFRFEKNVIDQYYVETCEACASSIPFSEMIDAADNGGYCGWCIHQINKDD